MSEKPFEIVIQPYSWTAFFTVCESIPYEAKGIFYSEMFLFLQACQQVATDIIIESGTYLGFSTQLLANAFQGPILTVDQHQKLVPEMHIWGNNVQAFQGDSFDAIPGLITRLPELATVGILIDGPKDEKALELKDRCFEFPAVKVVGIHDIEPMPCQAAHSWDQNYRKSVGQKLDTLIDHPYAQKYPKGPGLGIWIAE